MYNSANEKLITLAKKIVKAGKDIAKDEINKEYCAAHSSDGTITVISDSGFEAILIGNDERGSRDGYMYLYFKNTSQTNSFPSSKAIAKLLMQVVLEFPLPQGKGTAAYHDWPEYGGIPKQLHYFSELVQTFAGLTKQEYGQLAASVTPRQTDTAK